MSREQHELVELKWKETNHFKVHNVGNYLQSIWINEQKTGEFPLESKKLTAICDLHWLFLIGRDIYTTPLEQLDKRQILWTMGRIIFVCEQISAAEGEPGVSAQRLLEHYKEMVAYLTKRHDQLNKAPISEDPALTINTDASSSYYVLGSSDYQSHSYDPYPDYCWWHYQYQYPTLHQDPLIRLAFSNYDNNPWIDPSRELFTEIKLVDHAVELLRSGVSAEVKCYSDCCQGLGQSLGDCCQWLGQTLSDCCGRTLDCFSNCGSGVCDFLQGCCGVLSSCDCSCDCRCEDDCFKGICGVCAAGGAGITWCVNICSVGNSSTDSGNGVHGVHGYGAAKVGGHLSVSASQVFAPTAGGYITGSYALIFGLPVMYNYFSSLAKMFTGGVREQTRSRDRRAGLADLAGSSVLGTVLFWGGWFVPYGGPHTAIALGIAGSKLGKGLSKSYRKEQERQIYGGFSGKPAKYVPTQTVLEQLLYDAEFAEQPGLSLENRAQFFRETLNLILEKDEKTTHDRPSLLGRPRENFLAAQERLQKISSIIAYCYQQAMKAKTQETEKQSLLRHGLCALPRAYMSLFGDHYTVTPARKEALGAIKSLQEGTIADAQTLYDQSVPRLG